MLLLCPNACRNISRHCLLVIARSGKSPTPCNFNILRKKYRKSRPVVARNSARASTLAHPASAKLTVCSCACSAFWPNSTTWRHLDKSPGHTRTRLHASCAASSTHTPVLSNNVIAACSSAVIVCCVVFMIMKDDVNIKLFLSLKIIKFSLNPREALGKRICLHIYTFRRKLKV